MKTELLRLRKGDLVAVGVVIVLAVAVFLGFLPGKQTATGQAEIYLNGERIKTLDMSEDQTFTVSGHYQNVIRVEDGAVSIIRSDCPGQDCVHSGSIRNAGRILVCLPNGLEIRVTGAETDVDFVVR